MGQEARENSALLKYEKYCFKYLCALVDAKRGSSDSAPERIQRPFFPLIPAPLVATDPSSACRVATPGGFRISKGGRVRASLLVDALGLVKGCRATIKREEKREWQVT